MDAPSSCTSGAAAFSVFGEQPYALWANGVYNAIWLDHTAVVSQVAFSTLTNNAVRGTVSQVSSATATAGVIGGAYLAPIGTDHLITAWAQNEPGFTLSVRHAELSATGTVVVSDTMDFRDPTPAQSITQLFPIIPGTNAATVLVNDLRSGEFNQTGSKFAAGGGKVGSDIDLIPDSPRESVYDVAQLDGAGVLVWERADSQHLRVGTRDKNGAVVGLDADVTSTNGGLAGIAASPTQIAIAWQDMTTGFIQFSRFPRDLSNQATTAVAGSSMIGDTKPAVVWAGDHWVLAWIDETADVLHVITLDAQGNMTGTLLTTTARGGDTQVGLAANGSSVFVVWSDANAVSYQLICQ